jgi:glutathionylspermidine synthase
MTEEETAALVAANNARVERLGQQGVRLPVETMRAMFLAQAIVRYLVDLGLDDVEQCVEAASAELWSTTLDQIESTVAQARLLAGVHVDPEALRKMQSNGGLGG